MINFIFTTLIVKIFQSILIVLSILGPNLKVIFSGRPTASILPLSAIQNKPNKKQEKMV